MAVEADAHQVEGLALEPVLNADAPTARNLQQVVVDAEARALGLGQPGEAPGAGRVDVPAPCCALVARDLLLRLRPAEVVRRREIGEEVEALLVAQVEARFAQAGRIDYQRRLAVGLVRFHQSRYSLKGQLATPRIS